MLIFVGSDVSGEELILLLVFVGVKVIGFFVCMVVIGKWIMFLFFIEISKIKLEELFVFIVLVVVFLFVVIVYLLGLVMVLGVFMVGMMLGESYF